MQIDGKLAGRIVGIGFLAFIGYNIVSNSYKAAHEKPKNWVDAEAIVDTVGEEKSSGRVGHLRVPQVKDFLTYKYVYQNGEHSGKGELSIGGVGHFNQGQHVKIKVNADNPDESEFHEYDQ